MASLFVLHWISPLIVWLDRKYCVRLLNLSIDRTIDWLIDGTWSIFSWISCLIGSLSLIYSLIDERFLTVHALLPFSHRTQTTAYAVSGTTLISPTRPWFSCISSNTTRPRPSRNASSRSCSSKNRTPIPTWCKWPSNRRTRVSKCSSPHAKISFPPNQSTLLHRPYHTTPCPHPTTSPPSAPVFSIFFEKKCFLISQFFKNYSILIFLSFSIWTCVNISTVLHPN